MKILQSWTCRFSPLFLSFLVKMDGPCLDTNPHWLNIIDYSPSTPTKISPLPIFAPTAVHPFTATLISVLTTPSASPSDSTHSTLQGATYNTVTKSVNQTSTFCNFIPMFVNVEVKKRHVATDPAIQLGAWIAAEFRKRLIEGWTDMGFEDMQGNSLSFGSPVFAIEFEADNWLLYVSLLSSSHSNLANSQRTSQKRMMRWMQRSRTSRCPFLVLWCWEIRILWMIWTGLCGIFVIFLYGARLSLRSGGRKLSWRHARNDLGPVRVRDFGGSGRNEPNTSRTLQNSGVSDTRNYKHRV